MALFRLLETVDPQAAHTCAVAATTGGEALLQREALRHLGAVPFTPEVARALHHLVESAHESVRLAALPVMAARGGPRVFAALLAHVDKHAARLTTAEAEAAGLALARSSPDEALATFEAWLHPKGGGLLGKLVKMHAPAAAPARRVLGPQEPRRARGHVAPRASGRPRRRGAAARGWCRSGHAPAGPRRPPWLIPRRISATRSATPRRRSRARSGAPASARIAPSANLVRELGERLAHLLSGLLRMTRLHSPDNSAFNKPVADLHAALVQLHDLLGSVYLVAVEDQVYVNDIRIRSGDKASSIPELGAELQRHNAGGITFHLPLDGPAIRALVACLAAAPAAQEPRNGLVKALHAAGLRGLELQGRFRFRMASEEAREARDPRDFVSRALSATDEAFQNLAKGRVPNAAAAAPRRRRDAGTRLRRRGAVARSTGGSGLRLPPAAGRAARARGGPRAAAAAGRPPGPGHGRALPRLRLRGGRPGRRPGSRSPSSATPRWERA